jgi:dihydrofolate synthase/folylpolyglutamate synthase
MGSIAVEWVNMTIEPEYQQALDYLYHFIDYSLTRSDRYAPDKFNLDRMRALMKALNNPHTRYPIIHVAGTKGKGSVSALCANALHAHGYRVGLYTSPHLSDFVERFQINGKPMSHARFVNLLDGLKPTIESIPELTTFEIATGLAFLEFAQEKVDAAVFEVGLGGRLDATNVAAPLVAVITSISYDHTQFLGETLAEIAEEKAGIVKPGIPVVLAPQKQVARQVVDRIASERGSRVIHIGEDFLFTAVSRSLSGQTFLVWSSDEQALANNYFDSGGSQGWEPTRLHILLLGPHQIENAATAYAALLIARQEGLNVSESAIRAGFAATEWPGRFEILNREPTVIIDSAHNRDSALKLRLTLDDHFPGAPIILVFGASEDKNVHGMFSELLPRAKHLITTRSTHPRAMDPDELVRIGQQFGKSVKATESIESAIEAAIKLANSESIILVTGSLFVAAGAREVWYESHVLENSPTGNGTFSPPNQGQNGV